MPVDMTDRDNPPAFQDILDMLKARGEYGAVYSLLKDFCEMNSLYHRVQDAETRLRNIRNVLDRSDEDAEE